MSQSDTVDQLSSQITNKASKASSSQNGTSGKSVLVVDDDRGLLQLIEMRLQAEGYQAHCAESGEQALDMLEQISPAAVISDLKMDGMDGLALLEKIHQVRPVLPVIILTAHGSIPDAVLAAQKGVFAFLTKPINKQELFSSLEQACKINGNEQEEQSTWCDSIITRSAKMFELMEQAQLVANSDVSVLVLGESGTGKELVAEAIHNSSPRCEGPFVPINCGAIPAELLESELFGYRKGAFTGATKDYDGLFVQSNGGTLFLDEIGDMPMSLQVKLLRVLQEEKVRPLGSGQQISVNLRVIAATHQKLEQSIADGKFREDLYYRLNVVSLQLPPLSERKEDIPLLINHFLKNIANKTDKPLKKIATEAMKLAMQYHWPGNIRQLQNLVEKTVALCPGQVISETLVANSLPTQSQQVSPLTEAKQHFEKDYVKHLLKLTDGNIPEAAEIAGRNRSDFYKIVKRHGIDVDRYKFSSDES